MVKFSVKKNDLPIANEKQEKGLKNCTSFLCQIGDWSRTLVSSDKGFGFEFPSGHSILTYVDLNFNEFNKLPLGYANLYP